VENYPVYIIYRKNSVEKEKKTGKNGYVCMWIEVCGK
jgi:hypothetical protein